MIALQSGVFIYSPYDIREFKHVKGNPLAAVNYTLQGWNLLWTLDPSVDDWRVNNWKLPAWYFPLYGTIATEFNWLGGEVFSELRKPPTIQLVKSLEGYVKQCEIGISHSIQDRLFLTHTPDLAEVSNVISFIRKA